MSVGGIRRVIIPSKLAYQAAAEKSDNGSAFTVEQCQNGEGLGPRPLASEKAFHPLMFQRFTNIYCSGAMDNDDGSGSSSQQPDLVMDIELLE